MRTTIIATLAASAVLAIAPQASAQVDWRRPCVLEDDINCVWDGHHMGNGVGRSFIVRGTYNDAVVTYISHRRAHRILVRAGYGL